MCKNFFFKSLSFSSFPYRSLTKQVMNWSLLPTTDLKSFFPVVAITDPLWLQPRPFSSPIETSINPSVDANNESKFLTNVYHVEASTYVCFSTSMKNKTFCLGALMTIAIWSSNRYNLTSEPFKESLISIYSHLERAIFWGPNAHWIWRDSKAASSSNGNSGLLLELDKLIST